MEWVDIWTEQTSKHVLVQMKL